MNYVAFGLALALIFTEGLSNSAELVSQVSASQKNAADEMWHSIDPPPKPARLESFAAIAAGPMARSVRDT